MTPPLGGPIARTASREEGRAGVQKREASRELEDAYHRSQSAALSAYPDNAPRHRTTTECHQRHSVSLLAETSS